MWAGIERFPAIRTSSATIPPTTIPTATVHIMPMRKATIPMMSPMIAMAPFLGMRAATYTQAMPPTMPPIAWVQYAMSMLKLSTIERIMKKRNMTTPNTARSMKSFAV